MDAILGQRFHSRQAIAWHKKGTTFPLEQNVTASEAVDAVTGEVRIVAAPVFYQPPAEDTSEGATPPSLVELKEQRAIIRPPTGDDPETRFFGMVSDRWQVHQYGDYAKALDPLGDVYPVETCALLEEGRRLFISFRGEDRAVASVDEINNYFVAVISQNPGEASRVLHTPTRPVCRNTLNLGMSLASLNLHVPHVGDPTEAIGFAARLTAMMVKQTDKILGYFDLFAKTAIDPQALETIIQAAYPEPRLPAKARLFQSLTPEQIAVMSNSQVSGGLADAEKALEGWAVKKDKVAAIRRATMQRYEAFNDQHPDLARTVWAAYNAVTEVSDWREGRGDVALSVLMGQRANEKAQAFTAAAQVCGITLN